MLGDTKRDGVSLGQNCWASLLNQPTSSKKGESDMDLLVVLIILILLFGGGGSYWGYRQYGGRGAGIGLVGIIIVIVIVLLLMGRI